MLALARTSARIMVVLAVVGLAPGCAGRCEQVAAARKVLQAHPTGERPLDVRMIVPLARANELLAALLVAQPVTMPLAPPHLGPLTLPSQVALTAVARAVQLRPGPLARSGSRCR